MVNRFHGLEILKIPKNIGDTLGGECRQRCTECGKFVSKAELAKVPYGCVPWCDQCVSACDRIY